MIEYKTSRSVSNSSEDGLCNFIMIWRIECESFSEDMAFKWKIFVLTFYMTCIADFKYFHSFSLLFLKWFLRTIYSVGSCIPTELLLLGTLVRHVVERMARLNLSVSESLYTARFGQNLCMQVVFMLVFNSLKLILDTV
jgi:hypothetical protein